MAWLSLGSIRACFQWPCDMHQAGTWDEKFMAGFLASFTHPATWFDCTELHLLEVVGESLSMITGIVQQQKQH